MKQEVQAKDEKAAKGQGTEEVQNPEEGKLPFEIKGQEDIERLFEKHPVYKDEFLKDPKAFIAKYGSAKNDEPERTEEESEAEASDDDSDDEWLPKTSDDDTPAADAEALRKVEELKRDNQKLREQIQSNQNELQQVKDQLKPGSGEKAKLPTIPDAPKLPDDLDLYTDEGRKQFNDYAKALADSFAQLRTVAISTREELDKKTSELDGIKKDVSETKGHIESDKTQKTADKVVEDEFAAIDEMVAANPKLFGEVTRSVKDIEDDYIDSLTKMLTIAGSKMGLYSKGNSLSKDALAIKNLYLGESEKSQKFREMCGKKGVAFPEDYEVLRQVYDVRGIIEKDSPRDAEGNVLGRLSYSTAVRAYLGTDENISKIRVKDRNEAKSAKERALDKRKSFPKETNASAASAEVDLTKIDAKRVMYIAEKPISKRTPDETELLVSALRMKGKSEEEIRILTTA